MFPGSETVTVVRPARKGKYGDPGTGPDTEFDVDDCLLSPLDTTEETYQAERVTAGYTLYRLGPIDLQPADKVRARGELYDVFGKVRIWSTAGVEVSLVRTTG